MASWLVKVAGAIGIVTAIVGGVIGLGIDPVFWTPKPQFVAHAEDVKDDLKALSNQITQNTKAILEQRRSDWSEVERQAEAEAERLEAANKRIPQSVLRDLARSSQKITEIDTALDALDDGTHPTIH